MRAWMYDTMVNSEDLQAALLGSTPYSPEAMALRVMPRQSQTSTMTNIQNPRRFIIYGLGNNTNEQLAEANDHEAHRQFVQIWIHDEGGDYSVIDDLLDIVKRLFNGAVHPPSKVTSMIWLENSQEFESQSYQTLFRYARFQAIISKGAPQ